MRLSATRRTEYAVSGFTIVELLVVIAIVTVLAAVLLPVTIQARNRGRSAVCTSNLKQLSSALALYVQDWSDHLPHLEGSASRGSFAADSNPDGTSATCLRGLLEGRTKSSGAFKCLNDTGAPEYGFPERESVFPVTGSSYLPWSTARTGMYGIALNGAVPASVSQSSSTIALRDYGSDWHGVRVRRGLTVIDAGRANAAFADGHVSPVPVYSVTTAKGAYAGTATGSTASSGGITISGRTGYGSVDLGGRYKRSLGVGGSNHVLKVYVSGEISTSDGLYEIDRVYSFDGDAGMETVLRQIVSSLESAFAR